MQSIDDIVIVGGGPVGLFGAFYSGIRELKCSIVESLPQLGGQLITLYPKKYIYDVPGYPKILSQDLVEKLVIQGTQFHPSVHLNQKITHIQNAPSNNGKPILQLISDQGNSFFTHSAVMAIGAGAFTPRKPKIPNIISFEKQKLFYTVKDPDQFANQEILIIGGGDSALDWALMLENIARKITLIHRSDRFRAHEHSVQQIYQSKKINVLTFYELKNLAGQPNIQSAIIFNNKTHQELTIPISSVICSLGFITNIGPIKNWEFQFVKNQIQVNQTMETNIPAIWAAGDIASYPGKIKLIATGFSEIAIAVNMIKNYIDPNSKFFPGHSTAHSQMFNV